MKITLATIIAFIALIFTTNTYGQELGASLSEVEGRAGNQVLVNLSLSNNTEAAQTGINILFNPEIADIENLNVDVFPGPALQGADSFIVTGVKDTSSQDETNSKGLFIGIFPGVLPATLIPNGDVVSIIFTIDDDAEPEDFTDLVFSFMNFNATSFASQNGIPVTIDNSNFDNGLITVVRSGGGGSSSCALAQGSISGESMLDLAIILIPIAFVALRRVWKMS